MPVNAIDLFCGAGGLTHGLVRAGINVVAGVDLDPACRWPYEHNNNAHYLEKDVAAVGGNELHKLWPKRGVRLLAGCAPCQPFSTYRHGEDTRKDKKWKLLYEFARLIDETEPELVTMENVPQVRRHKVFTDFVKRLRGADYHVWCHVVNCQEYGIPQRRQRLVLLASKLGPIELIPPTHPDGHYVTVRQAIGHLPPIEAGETYKKDRLHCSSRLSPINLKRIQQSKPGGTWRDWDKRIVAKCHLKESGQTFSSVYGRMRWDEPAPTMTTLCFGYGNGRFGHPEQNRAITLREAAIFQSFPEDYQFVEPGRPAQFKIVGRLIGNAVPVRLGEVIGQSIQRHLNEARMRR